MAMTTRERSASGGAGDTDSGAWYGTSLAYDDLVLAAGAVTRFRDGDERGHALGLKDLSDAIEMRERILLAFERAERELCEPERQRLLTFVIVGGGPTGVELAGALGELARFVLARDFRHVQPGATRILLVDGGQRVLLREIALHDLHS